MYDTQSACDRPSNSVTLAAAPPVSLGEASRIYTERLLIEIEAVAARSLQA
jgi:hypothetical protein